MTYSKIKKIKYCADRLRAYEILYSIISDIEKDNFEESDFDVPKDIILSGLYNIRIGKLKESSLMNEFEDTMIDIMGENYFLFIPPESKTVKNLKEIYNKRKGELTWKIQSH